VDPGRECGDHAGGQSHEFDLIYGRPDQAPEDWEAELNRALALAPTHLSAYQLTMEPETPFFRLYERGRLVLPDEEDSLRMFRITERMTEAAGLFRYEVSNHAVPGEECRHNLLYWRYGEYAGIGPGAHSRLISPEGRRALRAFRAPGRWLAAADKSGWTCCCGRACWIGRNRGASR